jgi:hypothetical protein
VTDQPQPELDRQQLKDYVRTQAFDAGRPCEACDGEGVVYPGRRVIHTRLGPFGADWDESEVLAAIDTATNLQWARGLLGPFLAVVTADGRQIAVEIPAPVSALEAS